MTKREHAPCNVHMTHEVGPKELQYSTRLDIGYLETVRRERTGTARSEGQSSSIRREMQTLSEPITVPIAEKLSSNALVQGKHSQERTQYAK